MNALHRASDGVVDEVALQHSHSSIKASTAGVDEASDHSVEDEGQDLRKEKSKEATQSMDLSVGSIYSLLVLWLPLRVCVFRYVCLCYL